MTIYEEMMLRRGFGLQKRLHGIERNLVGGRLAQAEAVKEFRTEWLGVADICAWCAGEKGDNVRAAALLSKLIGVAGNVANLALSVPEQIYWREKAYSAARAAGLSNDELGHGAQLAYLHFAAGNTEAALGLLNVLLARNEELVESPGDATVNGLPKVERSSEERQLVRATILSHRGMFLATTNRDAEALPMLREAAAYFREHDPAALGRCLNSIAVVQDHLGRPEDAVKTLDEALALPVHDSAATALINRGSYLDSMGRTCESLASLEKGDRVARANAEQGAIALASIHLALWRIRHGDEVQRAQAVEWMERSLDLCRDAGDERLRLRVLHALEQVFVAAVESSEANAKQKTKAWRKLASVREQLGKTELEAEATRKYLASSPDDLEVQLDGNIRLGHIFVKLKQPEKALSHHETALAVLARLRAQGSEHRLEKAEVELLLSKGQALRATGTPEKAAEAYERARRVADDIGDLDALWRARGNLGLVHVDCGCFDKAVAGLKEVVTHYGQRGVTGGGPDLRLLGQARFNLAYAYQRRGNAAAAREEGKEALRILVLANDQKGIEEIKRQMVGW